jgi:hypothetical protein
MSTHRLYRNVKRSLGGMTAVLLPVLFAAAAPVIAWADAPAPSPTLKKSPGAWIGILVMFILLALVVSVSLLPAKRGHQD